jgi:hypothetical protein
MTKEKYCIQNRKYYSFYKQEIKNLERNYL